ncbi:hypothetical protein Plhal304r1_c021g0075581 [Plasmopara halstedii]
MRALSYLVIAAFAVANTAADPISHFWDIFINSTADVGNSVGRAAGAIGNGFVDAAGEVGSNVGKEPVVLQ